MKKEMMWTYLVHLGDCMWGDYEPGDGGRCIKTKPLLFHEPTWFEISNRLKEEGCCNTILIDVGEGVEYESYPEIKAPGTWSKQKLADEMGLDRHYLSRLFRENTGQSIQDYLVTTRLEEAARLLLLGHSVQDAALLCGYEDVSNFSKMFKKKYGKSPANWRNFELH